MAKSKTLKQWREERGLAQHELAARLEVAPSTIYSIEGGWTEPKVMLAQKIARELGITTDQIAWYLKPPEERAKHRKKATEAQDETAS